MKNEISFKIFMDHLEKIVNSKDLEHNLDERLFAEVLLNELIKIKSKKLITKFKETPRIPFLIMKVIDNGIYVTYKKDEVDYIKEENNRISLSVRKDISMSFMSVHYISLLRECIEFNKKNS